MSSEAFATVRKELYARGKSIHSVLQKMQGEMDKVQNFGRSKDCV